MQRPKEMKNENDFEKDNNVECIYSMSQEDILDKGRSGNI